MSKIKEYFTKEEKVTYVGTKFEHDLFNTFYRVGAICTGLVIGVGIRLATGSIIIQKF